MKTLKQKRKESIKTIAKQHKVKETGDLGDAFPKGIEKGINWDILSMKAGEVRDNELVVPLRLAKITVHTALLSLTHAIEVAIRSKMEIAEIIKPTDRTGLLVWLKDETLEKGDIAIINAKELDTILATLKANKQ